MDGTVCGSAVKLELNILSFMSKSINKTNQEIILHGKGLFSKEEVTVSISKGEKKSGIVFVLNNEKIPANVQYVTNATRNTVLSSGSESICLVEHFLAACSLLGVDDIEVKTNKNELIFEDGSALHWQQAFLNSDCCSKASGKYELKETIFLKKDKKQIAAIPHDGFK